MSTRAEQQCDVWNGKLKCLGQHKESDQHEELIIIPVLASAEEKNHNK